MCIHCSESRCRWIGQVLSVERKVGLYCRALGAHCRQNESQVPNMVRKQSNDTVDKGVRHLLDSQ
jgi:hypothetical protein